MLFLAHPKSFRAIAVKIEEKTRFMCHSNDCYKIPISGPDVVLAIFSFLHLEWKIIFILKSVLNWKAAKSYLSILLFTQVNENSNGFFLFAQKLKKASTPSGPEIGIL